MQRFEFCTEGREVAVALRRFLRSVVERDACPRKKVGSPLLTSSDISKDECKMTEQSRLYSSNGHPNPSERAGKHGRLAIPSSFLRQAWGKKDRVRPAIR